MGKRGHVGAVEGDLGAFLRELAIAVLDDAGARVPRLAREESWNWWCAFQSGLAGDAAAYAPDFEYIRAVRHGARARSRLSRRQQSLLVSIGMATPGHLDAPDWPAVACMWPTLTVAARVYRIPVSPLLAEAIEQAQGGDR